MKEYKDEKYRKELLWSPNKINAKIKPHSSQLL